MDANSLNQLRNTVLESMTNSELEASLGVAQLLLLGKYGIIAFNIKEWKIEYYGGQAYELLGYSEDEVEISMLRNLVHPDDIAQYNHNEEKLKSFFGNLNPEQIMKFKAGYDFRIRRKDGVYIHIYKQVIPMSYCVEFGLNKVLLVFTDISHLKSAQKFDVKYSGLNGEAVPVMTGTLTAKKIANNSPFSSREFEVLKLVAENKSSDKISDSLHISAHTVRIHRKNLLKKSGAKSSLELVMMAKERGWL